jgi:hypothetical protein
VSPLVCDGDGNLYLGSDDYAVPGIRKITPKGELTVLYQPGANPDVKVGAVGYFSVTPDWEVYVLVFPKNEITRYVLVFKPNGTYKTKIKLQPGFPWIPASMAVFPNGNLLLTGEEYNSKSDQPMLPFTGIFSPDGTLLKELQLEDDEPLHQMAVSHDARVTSALNPTSNRAISWGQMQAAKNGNIYVMLWLSPAVFYAVSPGGEVAKRFTVDSGNPDYKPIDMHISGSRIAVLFYQPQTMETVMKVVDWEGQELATYDETRANGKPKLDNLGLSFACYTAKPERFTFLVTGDDYKIELKRVEAR